jgi:hypothetical protein
MEQPPTLSSQPSHQPGYQFHKPRFLLRCAALLSLFLSLCLLIADGVRCVTIRNRYNDDPDTYYYYSPDSCWTEPSSGNLRPLIFVIFAMIWNIAELITVFVNKKGIHPCANLALDIVIFIAMVGQAGVGFWVLSFYRVNSRYTAAVVFMLFARLISPPFLHYKTNVHLIACFMALSLCLI